MLKVDALYCGTQWTVLTVLPRGTSCIFAHFTALVVLILAYAVECVEGHLEGRRRAAALREDDRVICQMGKAMNLLHLVSYLHV